MTIELAPLSEHIYALRRVFIQIGLILLIGTIALFCVSDTLIQFISAPLNEAIPHKRIEWKRLENQTASNKSYPLSDESTLVEIKEGYRLGDELILSPGGWADIKSVGKSHLALFSPAEGLILSLKLAVGASLILLAPFWLIPLFVFIRPALQAHEKRLFIPFVLLSFILMGLGALLALQVTIPLTNRYFFEFNEAIGQNLWGLKSYIDYWINLTAGHMLGFELLAVALFLIELNLLTYSVLKSKRRHMIVASLIIGALLTPPDVLSQLLLAVPLMALYEVALLFARYKQKN